MDRRIILKILLKFINILMKLQSFTMEVNKTLMEERGRIYDEIEKNQHNE
jgi:hypothetical protein